jgi:hypothetical protein
MSPAYLLMMTFLTGQLRTFDTSKIQAINASPYNGVSVPLVDAYDSSRLTYGQFEPDIRRIKQTAKKNIWPTIFLNRIIGCTDCPAPARQPAFTRIRGMDLDNSTGALSDFYDRFRLALKVARGLGAPGIIVDPEPYNDEALSVSRVAQLRNSQPTVIQESLEAVGVHLANIAAQYYPGATIWLLYTTLDKLGQPGRQNVAAFVTLGLLQQSKVHGESLRIIDGGEDRGYCYSSMARLQEMTEERKKAFSPFIKRFRNLALAGTITLWNSPSKRRGWLLQRTGELGECGRANLQGADFVPYLHFLLVSYRFVWIYAATMSDYNPYSSQASTFNRIIESALHEGSD